MQDKRDIENVVQGIMEEVRMHGAAWFVSGQSQANSDKDALYFETKAQSHWLAIQSKLRELVREQEEAKKYLDALAMRMFEKHYAKDEPYASGEVKFELFDNLPGVISQIDNMVSGLERSHNITNTSGEV